MCVGQYAYVCRSDVCRSECVFVDLGMCVSVDVCAYVSTGDIECVCEHVCMGRAEPQWPWAKSH